jgi:fatty acid amide hydrolase
MNELCRLSACELAARIASGEVSAREVISAHVAQIEAVNPALNAVVLPVFDEALAAARQADERQARGEPLGRLHGVPLTIKESFDVAGLPTTMGVTTLAKKPRAVDGPLVARLRAAGGIVLGKTNLSQLMLFHESDNPLYGATNNPWDLERSPGGSSGGEAAIIAAGGSPAGLASDLGGSIRVPGHFCGVAGIKPSSRRLSHRGAITNLRGMETVDWQPGPMARCVEDVERLMRVLVDDCMSVGESDVTPAPLRETPDVRGLRIAYWEDNGFFPCSPAVKRAVREAVAALAQQGAVVEAIAPPRMAEAMFLYTATIGADGAADAERLLRGSKVDRRLTQLLLLGRVPNWLRPLVAWAVERSGAPHKAGLVRAARWRSADEYWQLTARTQEYRRAWLDKFAQQFDALVLPAYALPAMRHGQSLDLIAAASDALFVNLLGAPSGVVPVTRVRAGEETNRPASREVAAKTAASVERDSAGLPVGVQVVSHYWREDLVLAVMQAIETGCMGSADFPSTPCNASTPAPSRGSVDAAGVATRP